ncbi:MAG: tetratricopeptide repeat protein [bacterium]|nr:tetratricopeptide repeat protein [bacterium]
MDDSHRLGRVWLYLALHFYVTGDDQATAFGQHALDLAMTGKDTRFQAQANNYLGLLYYSQGDYTPSRDYYRQARSLLEGDLLYERFDEVVFPAVLTRYRLTLCLAELGAFAEGVTMGTDPPRPGHHPFMGASFYADDIVVPMMS